jgi:hypothetical protein
MSHPKESNSNSAMALFALGHADASLSFSRLLPEDVGMDVTSILALRVLGSLWNQYRIDCKTNHGRSLLSIDNGYELRVFTTLIDGLAGWPPLVTANNIVRSHSPALSVVENQLYESVIDDSRDAVAEVCDQIARLPADLDPVKRASLLIDRCQKLEETLEFGVAWALNLVGANRLDMLCRSKAAAPFPALFNREMLRFDRSKVWRHQALSAALTEAAHHLSSVALESIHAVHNFRSVFPDLRRSSRLGTAFVFLAGLGELSPTQLARLIGCTEPGVRKMLKLLASAGLSIAQSPSPAFELVRSFRLGWPGAAWLRSYSMDDVAYVDPFDDE